MTDTLLNSSENATAEIQQQPKTPATPGGDSGKAATSTEEERQQAFYKDAPGDRKPAEKSDDEKKAEGDEKPGTDDDKKPEDDDKKDDDKKDDEGDEGDKGDDDKGEGEPLDLSGVEIDLPEGMELNTEILSDLGTLAGKLKLSKEAATEFIPIGVKLVENALAQQQENLTKARAEWREQVAADKEIGGPDETVRKQKLAIVDRGIRAIGTPELRTLLNDVGLGDHPEVLRAFYRAGLANSEDNIVNGGSGDTTNSLDKLYPTMTDQRN